jgi:hypothetical protein
MALTDTVDSRRGDKATLTQRSFSSDAFLQLAVALSWSWLWWAASIAFGGVETAAGAATWLVGGLGPAVSVAITLRGSTGAYRASFRQRLLMARVSWKWWLAAAAFAVSPKLIALSIAALGGHKAHGEAVGLAALPATLVFSMIVVAIEEPLWRGVALDSFEKQFFKASLVIGLFWSAWHVPLFAVDGTFQNDLGLGTVDFWVFALGVVGLSVFLTWLVIASGGSIFLAMFTHLLINLNGQLLPDDTTVRVLETGFIWLVAAALILRRADWSAPLGTKRQSELT